MARDLASNFANYIKGLTKEQFDIFSKTFIRAYWDVTTVVLVDGKGDGGIDIKFFEDNQQVKTPIQITVNKAVYTKLELDLPKIAKLVKEHGYSSIFYFMYSGSAAESKLEDLIDVARKKYSLTLEIYDCKRLGEMAQQPRYSELSRNLREMLGEFADTSNVRFSDVDKMKFDLISFGDDTFEIKSRIVQSFMLNELYNDEKIEFDELIKRTSEKFIINNGKDFCKRTLDSLLTDRKVKLISPLRTIVLNQDERARIGIAKNLLEIKETQFINDLDKILSKYNIKNKGAEFLIKIRDLYKENYKRDIDEISEALKNKNEDQQMFNTFKRYLSSVAKKGDVAPLSAEILGLCSANDFIQRVSAGELFYSMVNNSMLQAYINRQPKTVFLDTPVILHLLCAFYNKHSKFDNIYYKVAKDLLNSYWSGDIKMNWINQISRKAPLYCCKSMEVMKQIC